MPFGTLKKLVHLSQSRVQPNTRLIPSHNDVGYGILEDAEGHDVHVSHESVDSPHGFYDLRKGQQLAYALEDAPYLRAASVKILLQGAAAG
jgi:hypothetical protein